MSTARNFKSTLKYPVYIASHEVAKLVGWHPSRVRRLWVKHGIAMQLSQDKYGRPSGYVVTTPEKLMMMWPEQWEAVLEKLEEGRLEFPVELPPDFCEQQPRKR
jgi:hypothetical protein